MSTTNGLTTELPVGVWHVDPSAGELAFTARGMFGLARVRGTFATFDGTLIVTTDSTSGQLHIQAASLDTGNPKRDKHLRSADFFDTEAHPTVTFELTGVTPASADAITIAGVLRIGDHALAIQAPAEVSIAGPDQMTLSTRLDVDRAAAGVGWSKFGMIKGPAQLSARVSLTREA